MATYYIASSAPCKGFVKLTGWGTEKVKFVKDVRHAHPCETFESADALAKEIGLFCYVILSTSHN